MGINYWHEFKPTEVYHVYNKAIPGLKLFVDSTDYQVFLSNYLKLLDPYIDTFSYCLIPNHFHILIQVKSEKEMRLLAKTEATISSTKYLQDQISLDQFLTNQWKRFFSSYALLYKNRHSHLGPVFLKRFKRIAIGTEERLRQLVCYVHHNPIHHGICKNYSEWENSSFDLFENSSTLLSRDKIIDLFGGSKEFKQIHEDYRISFVDQRNR